MQKKIILTFVGTYLPGYKSGGPLWTIKNMVEHLSDEFEFWIVTKDRDLGDYLPYTNVRQNKWCEVGKARVYYCSPDRITISWLAKLINETHHDLVYLNSFFDPTFTIKTLIVRYLDKILNKPCVLAPRGEFSKGALQLKKRKKLIYLYIAQIFGLYNDIIWQASSELEAEDIACKFKVNKDKIHIATNLPAFIDKRIYPDTSIEEGHSTNFLRIIFLSRISPMKNLDYALQVLARVKANVQFDVYGPIEDAVYWQRCKLLIDSSPQNINITYCGSVLPDQILSTFAKYDLFFFPTHGENYGHVIAESLIVGTPVLLSDQTPWCDLKNDRLGWNLKLEDTEGFTQIIEDYSNMTHEDKNNLRYHIKNKIGERLTDPEVFEANRKLFRYAIKR